MRGDHDMVFYNQPAGGDGAVSLTASAGCADFSVDPARLPAAIEQIVFCLTVDGGQTFGALSDAAIGLTGGTGSPMRFTPPTTGATEAAMILGELYRRGDDWKFRAVGQGFNGGLAPLARSFGIEVDDDPAPAPAAALRHRRPIW